jgi:hypothetical protein
VPCWDAEGRLLTHPASRRPPPAARSPGRRHRRAEPARHCPVQAPRPARPACWLPRHPALAQSELPATRTGGSLSGCARKPTSPTSLTPPSADTGVCAFERAERDARTTLPRQLRLPRLLARWRAGEKRGAASGSWPAGPGAHCSSRGAVLAAGSGYGLIRSRQPWSGHSPASRASSSSPWAAQEARPRCVRRWRAGRSAPPARR